jgi:hypothetical protein
MGSSRSQADNIPPPLRSGDTIVDVPNLFSAGGGQRCPHRVKRVGFVMSGPAPIGVPSRNLTIPNLFYLIFGPAG